MSKKTDNTLQGWADLIMTPQSTTTKLEASEPTLEPSLEDVAIEAAELLDSLPTYVSDQTIRRAQQIAFALRACTENTLTRVSANGVPTVDRADRTRCASCRHEFCKECNELDECCKCDTEIPPRTVAERLAQHEHVEVVEGVLGGVNPLVSRRRISVHHILSYLYNGESINDIVENYKLTPEAIKDAIAFAQDVYDDTIDAALRNPAASPVAPVEQIDEVANRVNAAIARMDTSQKVDAATMALEINPAPAPSAAIQNDAATDALDEVLSFPRTANAETFAVARIQVAELRRRAVTSSSLARKAATEIVPALATYECPWCRVHPHKEPCCFECASARDEKHQRAARVDQITAIIERCLSEGEA